MKAKNLPLFMAMSVSASIAMAQPANDAIPILQDVGGLYASHFLTNATWSQPQSNGFYLREKASFMKAKRSSQLKTHLFNTELGYAHAFDGLGLTVGALFDEEGGRLHFGDSALSGVRVKARHQGARVFAHKTMGDSWLDLSVGFKRYQYRYEDVRLKMSALVSQLASGHRFSLNDGLYLEPSFKLSYTRTGSTELARITSQKVNSLIGLVGLKAGQHFSRGDVWGQVSLGREFMGKVTLITDKLSFPYEHKQNFYGLSVGGRFDVTKNLSLEGQAGLWTGNYLKTSPQVSVKGRYAF